MLNHAAEVVGVIMAQVQGEVFIKHSIILADNVHKGIFPVAPGIKGVTVPGIVGHSKEAYLGHLTLLHRVADHTQALRNLCFGSGKPHLVEGGVHISSIDTAVLVIIAGVVPPKSHGTLHQLLHLYEVGILQRAPHSAACGIDNDVGLGLADGIEIGLQLLLIGEVDGIDMGHIVDWQHRIGGIGVVLVVFLLQRVLQVVEEITIVVDIIKVPTGIVQENGKLPYSEGVHLAELGRHVGNSTGGRFSSVKINGLTAVGMDGPDKVDLCF